MELIGCREIEEGWYQFRYRYDNKEKELTVAYINDHLKNKDDLNNKIRYIKELVKEYYEGDVISISWRVL